MGDASNLIRSNQLPNFREMKQKTQGETYRYLNSLLRGKSYDSFENINDLINLSITLPYFEDSLRLIIIDRLHMENHVVQILLSQNDYHIKRILKCNWFFKNQLPADSYMTKIFPYVSVSLRHKLINRLSRYLENEKEGEVLFSFVLDNYSKKMAEWLLPRCSSAFILNYFTSCNSSFKSDPKPRLLHKITLRHPKVGMQILLSIFNSTHISYEYNFKKYKRTFYHLAGNHNDIFMIFFEKHQQKIQYLTFGKNLTVRYRGKIKELFLKSGEMSKKRLFKEEIIFQSLSPEEKIQFCVVIVLNADDKLTFYNWANSCSSLCSLLKFIPKDERLDFVESVFKRVYNLSFKDNPKCWKADILELLPAIQRQPFVETIEKLLDEESTDLNFSPRHMEELFYLYEFHIAFEKFKTLLGKASLVMKRMNILQNMVKNCKLHNDLKGLQELVEYVGTRHRHDDPTVISDFLVNIYIAFPTSTLNLRMLQKMNDLSYYCALKGYISDYGRTLEKYILHCLKTDVNTDALLENFFDFVILRTGYLYNFLQDIDSNFSRESKTLFLEVCKKIIHWIETHPSDNDNADSMFNRILYTYQEFRARHKNEKISLKEIPGVEEILKRKMKIHEEIGGEDWSPDIWEKFCTRTMEVYYRPALLWYTLRRNPDVIIKNLEKILNFLISAFFREYNLFFASLKKMTSFLEMTEKLAQVFLNEFKNGKSVGSQKHALELYSHICNIEEFSRAVEEYVPKGEIIEEQVDPKFSEIQLIVPRLIRNIHPQWKNLELIKKFFLGDFLQNLMPSFYSCCYHTRADVIVPFLREYLGKVPQRISYKKDVIRLIAELSNHRERIDFCVKCWDENKHYSLRRLLLLYLGKSFLEKPDKESFKALEKCIIESRETEIDARPSMNDVPSEFFNDYVSALWKFSEGQKPEERKNFRNSILWFFNQENMKFLSQEFCEDVIKNNLFKPSALEVEQFTAHYLASDSEVAMPRLQMILNLMKNPESDPSNVSSFLSILRASSLDYSASLCDILNFLLRNWKGYPLEVLHEERFMFMYYDLYHRILGKHENLTSVSVEFGQELKKLLLTFDYLSELITILVDTLKDLFSSLKLSKKPLSEVTVVKELVASTQDRRLAIIAILVLSPEAVNLYLQKETFDASDAARKKELDGLVQLLESLKDDVVAMYLKKKLGFKKSEQNKEPK